MDAQITYGQTIRWSEFSGGTRTIEVRGTDLAAVRDVAIQLATEVGWTPPKWWQFWRWGDTRP